jgi:hypothetical protein
MFKYVSREPTEKEKQIIRQKFAQLFANIATSYSNVQNHDDFVNLIYKQIILLDGNGVNWLIKVGSVNMTSTMHI